MDGAAVFSTGLPAAFSAELSLDTASLAPTGYSAALTKLVALPKISRLRRNVANELIPSFIEGHLL
jgi:hypothetical protein